MTKEERLEKGLTPEFLAYMDFLDKSGAEQVRSLRHVQKSYPPTEQEIAEQVAYTRSLSGIK